MKLIAILLAGVAAVSALEQEIYKLPPQRIANAKKFGEECAKEFNVDPGLLTKVPDGTLPRDEATNNYLYCFALKAGFIEKDGHMIVDKIVNLLGDHPRKEDLKEALIKCNEVTKENNIATIVEMNNCLATAPIKFQL